MLSWSITFLIIGLIAGVLGLSGIAGAATQIAWILFVVFLVLFVVRILWYSDSARHSRLWQSVRFFLQRSRWSLDDKSRVLV